MRRQSWDRRPTRRSPPRTTVDTTGDSGPRLETCPTSWNGVSSPARAAAFKDRFTNETVPLSARGTYSDSHGARRDLVGIPVRGLRPGRVRATARRMACGRLDAHGSGPRCPRASRLVTLSSPGVGPPLGPRISTPGDSIHAAPRRDRRRAFGRRCRGLLRQRAGRDHHRALQDRSEPSAGAQENHRRGEVRHPGMGGLVQPPPAPATHRGYPTGGTGAVVLSAVAGVGQGGLTQIRNSPGDPARFTQKIQRAEGRLGEEQTLEPVTYSPSRSSISATVSRAARPLPSTLGQRDYIMQNPGHLNSGSMRKWRRSAFFVQPCRIARAFGPNRAIVRYSRLSTSWCSLRLDRYSLVT